MLNPNNTKGSRERKARVLNSLIDQWYQLTDRRWRVESNLNPIYTDEALFIWGIEREEVTQKELDDLNLQIKVNDSETNKVFEELQKMYKELAEDKETPSV